MSNARTYGTIHSEQKPFVIQHADSTDYLLGGSLVMKNGKIDKILFDGGYAQATAVNKTTKDKFAFYYYNQDHLGNNREVVDANGVVQQVTNYYPFGAPYVDATAVKCDSLQPYKYNGKELDLMHGLNTYDYGARQHDPILARWDRMDPLSEKYYSTSPYAYCNNSPINAVDPDGNLTVFINGFMANLYWGSSGYWAKQAYVFMNIFREENTPIFRDGSLGGFIGILPSSSTDPLVSECSSLNPQMRFDAGKCQGAKDAKMLFGRLGKDKNGNIIEPLRLATHSMGGAYGKGYATALMEYYQKHKKKYKGLRIFEYDFAPFQAESQTAVDGVMTWQIHDVNDWIAPATPILGSYYLEVNSGLGHADSHMIDNSAFWEKVAQLGPGIYNVENGTIVPQQ